jgi:hypothetical protein
MAAVGDRVITGTDAVKWAANWRDSAKTDRSVMEAAVCPSDPTASARSPRSATYAAVFAALGDYLAVDEDADA